MIISNIAAPLLGLVDTAIIGHLPQSIYLSAVALGAMIVSFIYLLAIFLRMTTTAEIAHAFGAKNHAAAQQVVVHGMVLAVGIGLLLLLVFRGGSSTPVLTCSATRHNILVSGFGRHPLH